MGVTKKCPTGTQCCFDSYGNWTGCWDPSKCEECINGVVVENDIEALKAACKKCNFIDKAGVPVFLGVEELCNKNYEGCCYGVCYNLNCEDCNHDTKQKEPKCPKTGKICCSNPSGSVSSCYDPKNCEECEPFFNVFTGVVREKNCKPLSGLTDDCCKGTCFNSKCQNCDKETGAITDKYDKKKCETCNTTTGEISQKLTQEEKDNCKACDENGATYTQCPPNKCCKGKCYDPRCKTCVNGELQDANIGCSSGQICCAGDCISITSCEGCDTDDNGTQYKTNNKCENNTDGKTSCCNGECFDSTCEKCQSNQIVPDLSKDNNGTCCGGAVITNSAKQGCCKRSQYVPGEIYDKSFYDCCPNALGSSSGVFSRNFYGCCKYGDSSYNTLYEKATEGCCESATSASKTYIKKSNECCGPIIINSKTETCCGNYSVVKNCGKCDNDPNNRKNYNEKNCQECYNPGYLEPKVVSKCRPEVNNGKTLSCCDGTSTCYDPDNKTCSECKGDGDNKEFAPTCPRQGDPESYTGCCGGECYDPNEKCGLVCYDTPSKKYPDNPQQQLASKCPKRSWSEAFNGFFIVGSPNSLCCDGECIEDACYTCNNGIKTRLCPSPEDPSKIFCCGNGQCYGICEECKSYTDPITNERKSKVIRKGQAIDRNGNVSGDSICVGCCNNNTQCCPSACCSDKCCAENEECCLGECKPKGYIECDGQCVPKDRCCNNQVLSENDICCNNQAKNKNDCECCNNSCLEPSQKCCTKSDGITKFVCSKTDTCCGDFCCENICCNNKDCCDENCCEGPHGGCFSVNSCQKCEGGIVKDDTTSDERCCAGKKYNPKKCEDCPDGVVISTLTQPTCYCYNGKSVCNCNGRFASIEIGIIGYDGEQLEDEWYSYQLFAWKNGSWIAIGGDYSAGWPNKTTTYDLSSYAVPDGTTDKCVVRYKITTEASSNDDGDIFLVIDGNSSWFGGREGEIII